MDDGWNADGDKLREDAEQDSKVGQHELLTRLEEVRRALSSAAAEIRANNLHSARDFLGTCVEQNLDASPDNLLIGTSLQMAAAVRAHQDVLVVVIEKFDQGRLLGALESADLYS